MVRLNGILKGDKLVLVEFFATWCPHCQKMRPILDRVEKENKEYLQVERFDIDAPENEKLLNYYRIQSVPTFLLFLPGRSGMEAKWGNVGRTVGREGRKV